jgi:hypothetical protein
MPCAVGALVVGRAEHHEDGHHQRLTVLHHRLLRAVPWYHRQQRVEPWRW